MLQNEDHAPWVVQKYGGTSVGKFLDVITGDIVSSWLQNYRVVVVCSARSGETKAKGTTNRQVVSKILRARQAYVSLHRLLAAAESALTPGCVKYKTLIEIILQDHLDVAKKEIRDREILTQLEQELTFECDKISRFLDAAKIIDEVSPKSKDIIMSLGEKLACEIVAAALRDKGIDAEYLSLANIIDRDFEILDQPFYDYLSERFAQAIDACGSKIPVVTGFFGPVPGSLLSSIGRGYTDLCAALCAVGLNAEELQIWKEVDGIFTADPRKVATARLLPIITPEEAAELTYYGSEVIHPFTMEQVIRAGVPIRIKNVENPKGAGTVIFPDQSQAASGASTPQLHSPKLLLDNGYHLDLTRRHPTAITIKDNVIILNVHSNKKTISHGFFAQIFSTLDRYGIVVDLISTSEVHISMALGIESTALGRDLEKAIVELRRLGTVSLSRNMAILSLVGKQMRNLVGISGKMFSTLAKANVNIEMISQGASEINISCVVAEKHAMRAMQCIHEELLSAHPRIDSDDFL
ncbi:hypothetical protein BZG36_01992 [Bifiguratus adelaidae]|uniref:Aspartokinase n=1 Tax=Bifiguratus adelaidae TaxID=1938954 RepID=A0A261Y470_9FUNG|nr:hypothetical protein BZG36_01992 [Bifiguratus adelaidae]